MTTSTTGRTAPGAAYPLPGDERERTRLAHQGDLLAPLTRAVLREAGIGPGAAVLDVGAGVGDVALLLAELVGPAGRVVVLDRDAEALRTAERRLAAAGTAPFEVIHGDLHDAGAEERVDAVVGRLVLMYVPDAALALRALADRLRPGGLLVSIEADFTFCSVAEPPVPLVDEVRHWLTETFRRSGVDPQCGLHLRRSFCRAGLDEPDLRFTNLIGGGPDFGGYRLVADTLRSLLPRAEATGVTTASAVDVDTLADRLRAQVVGAEATLATISLVSAWARTDGTEGER